jgi:glutamate dehydrogenase
MHSSWKADLDKKLIKSYGEKKGTNLSSKYATAFHSSYREDCTVETALDDIKHIELLNPKNTVGLEFYAIDNAELHLRLFQYDKPIPLSDVLPMLENMDLRTLDERPYKVSLDTVSTWISDFTVVYAHSGTLNLEKVKDIFQEAFIDMRAGRSENDGFNKLIIGAQLSWREITILRAYAKYLRQTGFAFSQSYIEDALVAHADITKDLLALFKTRFDPKLKNKGAEELESKISAALEAITSLDEDRIVRRIWNLINATLRTNYFQPDADGNQKEYLSFKLNSSQVPELPLPVPLYEIFVYSPRFEAIHLRAAKVSRGGIRWSDRKEDFRTEILGLMKAQKVKNAVIVPSGAKGGFVLKALPADAARDTIKNEVITCYKSFISGLLDLTDNLKNGKTIHPPHVVCYDDDDTYLVVAADKGTASFSDTANEISKKYDFWLGDAFASGGSVGYDHKKMGITARGAWESVKRHFHELNIDVTSTDFTVIGIGDMSGDVFGNGMIYTPHIKLIGAFDHRNIFIDPDPNAPATYKERVRLFDLPASSWEDFNPALISKGGGVFKRTAKSITLTPEIKKALDVKENALAPNELIRAMLKAPVDLLWNGGIGTYVKAAIESHADVGDKTNEYTRVNGDELRARIVGEGGNLGFTQLGRIEFALSGGLINTDFIDNSAGVDCSDHEVNLKILLNQEVAKGVITEKERNKILASMTQEVADLVLQDNFNQALVLSVASFNAPALIGLHQNFIKEMETLNVINRAVEFLPDDKKILERKTAGLGLTRPEIAVLLSYAKIDIKSHILLSDLPEDPYLSQILDTAFPASLKKKFAIAMAKHSLHREIVATQLSNFIVNETGILFVYNLESETGSTVAEAVRATLAAIRIFRTSELQKVIESLDFKIPIATQYELLAFIRRLVYLSARWFLHRKKLINENLEETINTFSEKVKKLENFIPTLMGGSTKEYLKTLTEQFAAAGISNDIARRIATARALYTSLNIIEVSVAQDTDLLKTAEMYFAVGEYFNLLWFRDRLASDSREGYWEIVSRLTLRDELDMLQRSITASVMRATRKTADTIESIESWIAANHRSMVRWEKILEMLHMSTSLDYVMFFIALRELASLIHANEV